MGSSETGGGVVEGVVDSSVGSIVWVRRRNGSWWPGKVLGTDELSPHLTSPRSGTPVKLLGREDASVDWYNLEKSKRVKEFRCGEFDECIERAEAAQGIPPKKREKYARREDAILHALELERQILEKKYGKLGFSMNDDIGEKLSDAVTSSRFLENGGGNQESPISNKISEEHSSSPADKNVTDNTNEETLKEGNELSGDDRNACIPPRMRGLQDFGLLTTPIKEELSGVAFRAKRSRYMYPTDDSGNYLNDSGIQPSEMNIPVPKFEDSDPLYSADLSEEPISRSTEDTETDCSETDSLESDSDEDMTAFSDGSASIELQPKYPMITEVHEEHGSISSNDLEGLVYADEPPQPFSNGPVSTSMEESKWQQKGKRNDRRLGKRPLGIIDSEASRGYMTTRNSNRNNRGFKADSIRSFRTHLQDPCHNTLEFECSTWNNPPAVRGYLEYSQEGDDPLFFGTHHLGGRIILVDVDLKVEASNYRRDVPMISLMSKLNGHAIVGHPIQVEALESGSSQNLLTGNEYFFTKSSESPPVLPRIWRTGRRTTNFRVPRPNMYSALDSESGLKTPLANQGREQGSLGQKANVSRNRFSQYPVDGKSLRNSPKKMSLSSNMKIRTLSSIESENKHHVYPISGGTHNQDDGLMKTEYLPTPIACIPINLVFSRLHEELDGRHQ